MLELDIPAEVIAEIVNILERMKAHQNHIWEEAPGLHDDYKKWRALIHDLELLDGTLNQRSIPGLSSYGELFLLKYGCKSEAKPARTRGRKSIDREQDKRIMDAWQFGEDDKYEQLAGKLGLPVREVKLAIDREEKHRANLQEQS